MRTLKITIAISLISILTSCSGTMYLVQTSPKETKVILSTITYIKDSRTGLCYAISKNINEYSLFGLASYQLTCVPCDSLKNVSVIK